MEPAGAEGHRLVNHTGETAYGVTVRALDEAAQTWNAGLTPERATDRPTEISYAEEVADGADVGGLTFTLGDPPSGILGVMWAESPGGPLDHEETIIASYQLESSHFGWRAEP